MPVDPPLLGGRKVPIVGVTGLRIQKGLEPSEECILAGKRHELAEESAVLDLTQTRRQVVGKRGNIVI
jgi:hypothetical protein